MFIADEPGAWSGPGGATAWNSPRVFADAGRFRGAMARLASGVAVVTCLDRGRPSGLLVSSLTSLSVEPPRMLFCVGKTAGSHDALLRAERCALCVLSDRDAAEARRFATPGLGEARFGSGAWRFEPGEPPVHATAMISLTGTISEQTDAGSHTVFFLDVETITMADAAPLIYFDRAFHALDLTTPVS